MNYRTMGAIAAYAIAAATLLVLGVLACFATLWGVNRLALFPLYFIGLLLCGGAVAVAVTIRKSKSDTTISCA